MPCRVGASSSWNATDSVGQCSRVQGNIKLSGDSTKEPRMIPQCEGRPLSHSRCVQLLYCPTHCPSLQMMCHVCDVTLQMMVARSPWRWDHAPSGIWGSAHPVAGCKNTHVICKSDCWKMKKNIDTSMSNKYPTIECNIVHAIVTSKQWNNISAPQGSI